MAIIEKRADKSSYIIESIYRKKIISKILPSLAKSNITPNQITMLNIIISIILLVYSLDGNLLIISLGIQVYEILDHLDGDLARYKKMTSELGRKLDVISDNIFVNGIILMIGYRNDCILISFIIVIVIYIYGHITTKYIVPQIRKIKHFTRVGMKKYFFEKGYILGMDFTLFGFILSVGIHLIKIKYLYIFMIILYIVDLSYRIFEVNMNKKGASN